ncbi:hypothetical protein QX776_05020 [Alteromonadaceae bacterium BrNp21-10]|nr:hypothetical protein [Alteromonadaceae bacterium BrNp21-10]
MTLFFYFDPAIKIWLNSLGISLVIGIALMLSVSKSKEAPTDYWQTFRLFMMPFCVSSFSSLIKDQGYILILPPKVEEQAVSVGACVLFIALIYSIKYFKKFNVGKE